MYDVCYLIAHTFTYDDYGNAIEKETQREVFCERKSIGQNEYFKARETGLKAKMCLLINQLDYQDETELILNDERYFIYRSYDKDDFVEVYIAKN